MTNPEHDNQRVAGVDREGPDPFTSSRAPSIFIAVPLGLALFRDMVRGATPVLRASGCRVQVSDADVVPRSPWDVEGAIVAVFNADYAERIRQPQLPMINVSSRIDVTQLSLPSVVPDNVAAGRLAAEHLMSCGYAHYGYVALANMYFSDLRVKGFCDALQQRGHTAVRLNDLGERAIAEGEGHPWLSAGHTPCGVMAVGDDRAERLVQTCHRMGWRIPDDVGIVGVNNDEMVCETMEPTLSSVDLNARKIGAAAGSLLLRMLEGQPPPREPVLIAPRGVVERPSSGAPVIDDPVVREACLLMDRHPAHMRTVEAVAGQFSISRRMFERRFSDAMGMPPGIYLRQRRLLAVQRRLADTNDPIKQIAIDAGYSSLQSFTQAFRSQSGMTPAAYRKSHQA